MPLIQSLLWWANPPQILAQKLWMLFSGGDVGLLRLLAATNLDDHYLQSLGYLISAKLKPDLPTVAVVLAEAARAAADYARERTIDQLNQKFTSIC